MSTAREIPGFYYDQVRNKYFRVQPDHRAPSGAAHSKSAIKAKQEATALEQTRTKRQDRERKGRIQRQDASRFTSLSLSIRIGRNPRGVLTELVQNYVSRFQKSTGELFDGRKLEAFTVTPNGQLYTMVSSTEGRSPYNIRHATSLGPAPWMMAPMQYQSNAWATLSSVASRYLLYAYGPTLVCAPLHDNSADLMFIQNRYLDLVITDIAVSPDLTSHNLALATDNGLHVGVLPLQAPAPGRCPDLSKEQMVATFKDNNIVMSGERSGAVNFTDIRAAGSVHRLQHSSGTNGIVMGRNTNHIIVSGLGTIALYDLRYTKAVNQRKRRRTGKFASSKPLVPFYVPRSHKTDRYAPGKNLAYSSNLDIAVVACQGATSNTGHTGGVLLYNASTGQIIDTPISGYGLESMRGVAIARVRDGPESIFVGEERKLHEYRVDSFNGDDIEVPARTATATGNVSRSQESSVCDLLKDRFPLDAKPRMAQRWRRGDVGPV